MATADIMILAMTIIYLKYKSLGFASKIIGQVHDSLIFDCKKEEIKQLAEMCINIFNKLPDYIEQVWGIEEFNVPLTGDAEYGENWGDLKELKLAA
jgi:DNA polymerase I-like protein with 3'-5' exonuclease and polymerase domains